MKIEKVIATTLALLEIILFKGIIMHILKKYQKLNAGHGEKNIFIYAKGMMTGDIEIHMQEIYGDISDSTISRITDKILPIVKVYLRSIRWQKRAFSKQLKLG